MKKSIIFALGLSLCFISCNKDEPKDNTPKWTPAKYTATIEAPLTKTALNAGALEWAEGDSISVFDASGKHFKFIAATAGAQAEFVQSEETPEDINLEGLVCAVFPYCDTTIYENGDITIEVPSSNQVAKNGMASPKAGVLTAKMDTDKKFNFKSLCSYASVTIPNGMELTGAYIYCSHAAGHGISGKVSATIGGDGTPIINSVDDPVDGGVNVYGPEGGTIAPGTYFIPIIPGDYKNVRAKLDFAAVELTDTVLSSDIFVIEPFTAERNAVINIGEIYDTRDGFNWLDFENNRLPSEAAFPTDSDNRTGDFSVVVNPLKSGINTSSYCLKQFKEKGSTSGYFAFTGFNQSMFKRVKYIKIQVCFIDAPEDYYPRLRFNGSGTAFLPTKINGVAPSGDEFTQAEMKAAYDRTSWNELEFAVSLAGDTSIKSLSFRPMCYSTGNNVTANNSVVYFDNLTFLYR